MAVTLEVNAVGFKNPSGDYIGINAILPDKIVNVYNFKLVYNGLARSDGKTLITFEELAAAVDDPSSYVTITVETTRWSVSEGVILYFSHKNSTGSSLYFSQLPVDITTGGLIHYLGFRENSDGSININVNSWAVQNRDDRQTTIPISMSTSITASKYPNSNAVRSYVGTVLSRMKDCGIITDAQYQYISGQTNTAPSSGGPIIGGTIDEPLLTDP